MPASPEDKCPRTMRFWQWLLVVHMVFCCVHGGYAQKKTPKKRIYKASNLKNSRTDYTPFFEDINKKTYHYDRKALGRIYKHEEQKNWKKLLKTLRKYVSRFSMENFYTDTYLLWKLAKATELVKGLESAKPIYRTALRHYHEEVDLLDVEFYRNLLSEGEIASYVPLSYYYYLVEYRRYIDNLQAPKGQYLNMGTLINSEQADYAPYLNSSGDVLFFTSRRNEPKNELAEFSNEDIFYTQRNNERWQEAKMLEQINTRQFNEGSVCINRAADVLYFSRCDAPEGYGDCDLYSAKRKDGQWGAVRNMGAKVNSPAWDSHPTLSTSEDTLYFASDRQGGFGLSDIYFTYKNKKGVWQKARNTGPIINTRGNEVSPFVHHEEQVLYFSSDGQLYNFGGFDIFKSVLKNGRWGDPLNVGPLVNGAGHEHYFTISPNADFVYYAKSEDDSMKQDLYSFPLPMGAHPKATVRLTGTLKDQETLKPLQGIVSIIDLENGIEVAPKFLKEDGSFSFNLIDQNRYLLVIEGDEFLRIEEIFYLSGTKHLDKKTVPISRKIEFDSIEFDTGADEVSPSMHKELRKVIVFMQDYPSFHLEISGHTDSTGQAEDNLSLSKRRARNIARYLTEEGKLDAQRITHEGYGNARPIIEEETTEADRSINRRVEFFFKRKEQ